MSTYLHIGLHKTATTFLQSNFFPKLLGDISYVHPTKLIKPIRKITSSDGLLFSVNDVRNEILQMYLERKKIIISSENLSGNPGLQYINRTQTLKRLKDLFPEGKVIIGLREQWSLIGSMYKLYVQYGGTKCFSDYVFNESKIYKNETYFGLYNRINLNSFMYSPLLELLTSMFGSFNVHVFNYEKFKFDPNSELIQLAIFLGVDMPEDIKMNVVNNSIEWSKVDKIRVANRLNKSNYHEGGIFDRYSVIGDILKETTGLFCEKNKSFHQFQEFQKNDIFRNDREALKNKFGVFF